MALNVAEINIIIQNMVTDMVMAMDTAMAMGKIHNQLLYFKPYSFNCD